MFLVEDVIIDKMVHEVFAAFPGAIKLHAVLSPDMKILDIDKVTSTIEYQTSKDLKNIVSGILGDSYTPIDKMEKYVYNDNGRHTMSLENNVIHVYYMYKKENDEQRKQRGI